MGLIEIECPFGFSVFCLVQSCIFSFFFFFSSLHVCLRDNQHCNSIVVILFIIVHTLKNIKNKSNDTIHTFKNYFITILSVFSFQFLILTTINSIQTDPSDERRKSLKPNGAQLFGADIVGNDVFVTAVFSFCKFTFLSLKLYIHLKICRQFGHLHFFAIDFSTDRKGQRERMRKEEKRGETTTTEDLGLQSAWLSWRLRERNRGAGDKGFFML